jgi:hypothetical protein
MYVYTDHGRHDSGRAAPSLRAADGLGQAPTARPCCLLTPLAFIDPSALGTHQGTSERNGVLYTGAAGFIDTGHARHYCDVAKWVYDQIVALKGAPGPIKASEGKAEITRTIPATLWTAVARDIAFDEGLGHEIWTYWKPGPGLGNSAFSPEDLCSNHFGTYIAESAIRSLAAGGAASFGAAVTAALNTLLTNLKAQPLAETHKAWARIANCWTTGGLTAPLRRRNFSITPWKVGHASDVATPSWLLQGRGAGASYYTFTYSAMFMNIGTTTFAARIEDIRKDALKTYGMWYDKPGCP